MIALITLEHEAVSNPSQPDIEQISIRIELIPLMRQLLITMCKPAA